MNKFINEAVDILVTVDKNYIPPLKCMLYSLFTNNPGSKFNIYLIYSQIDEQGISEIHSYISVMGHNFLPIFAGEDFLSDAPINSYYSAAMYYRLLASEILPSSIKKILYLDPDILIINPVSGLVNTDISDYLYGACAHNGPIVDGINKVRLKSDSDRYFNSGVLLMNLERQREEIRASDIFNYIKRNENLLVLPDQDVLNGLYGERILLLDDSLYNLDVRKAADHYFSSFGEKDIEWLISNTVVLHFCGKQKPWNAQYLNRFGVLYKHYWTRAHNMNNAAVITS